MKTLSKFILIFVGVFSLYFLTGTREVLAQCATRCGCSNIGPPSNCVSYAVSGDCSDAMGTCTCMNAVGCGTAVGTSCFEPIVCTSSFTAFNPAPASCCGSPPPPTSPPGPTAPPPPAGWGACDSCSCGHPGQCRTDPTGACVWDPSGCGGGGSLPPTCDSMTVTYSPSSRVIEVGQTIRLTVRIQYRPPHVTLVYACAAEDPDRNYLWPDGIRNDSRNSVCTSVNNPTSGDERITLTMVGRAPGNASVKITGNVRIDGINGFNCPMERNTTIRVIEPIPDPWWQVIGGDAVSGAGAMSSILPSGQRLILGNTAGYPGMAVYNSTLGLGQGTVSSTLWAANTIYSDTQYSYEKFMELVPDGVVWNDISRLRSGGTKTGDYEWYRVNGNYTLQPNLMINGGRKIILFVSDDLTINANVRLNDVKNDYFMAIAGRNIIVANNVTNIAYGGGGTTLPTPTPPGGVYPTCGQACSLQTGSGTGCDSGLTCTSLTPSSAPICLNALCPTDPDCVCSYSNVQGATSNTYALEGIFYANGAFNSGTGNLPLGVRGSVVANTISLGRNLNSSNTTTPAETFEFGEENMLLYPKDLVGVVVAWKEVAP